MGVILLKISMFSTFDNGGAGNAAFRLNYALNQVGEDSTLYVKHKTTNEFKVSEITLTEVNNSLLDKVVYENFVNNIYEGNTICSAMYSSIGFSYLDLIKNTDIVNFHWVSMFVSLESIVRIHQRNIPIVWTLHDQNPMTGACHYTHGCSKYLIDCSQCPQLVKNEYDISKHLLDTKIKYLPKEIVIVSPSKWLANCARESQVFQKNRIEVIPNSVDCSAYRPFEKNEAKKRLNIFEHTRTILFGAQDLKERRKGFSELISIIKKMKQLPNISSLLKENQLHIITFGHPSPLLEELDIPYTSIGYTEENEKLRIAYSAADVVALPSLEDNLPNIMLESLACGTPIVAFDNGGMSDVIHQGKNGFLVSLDDLPNFANRLKDVLWGDSMSEYCRHHALQEYNLNTQGQRYKDLFEDVVANKQSNKTISLHVPSIFPEAAVALTPLLYESSSESSQNEK